MNDQTTLIGYLTTANAMIDAVKAEMTKGAVAPVQLETKSDADAHIAYWKDQLSKACVEIERLKKLCRDKDDELNEAASAHERELDQFKLTQNKNEAELEEKAKEIAEAREKLAFVSKRVGDLEVRTDDLTHQLKTGDTVIIACKVEIENKCQELRDADKKIEQFKYQAHIADTALVSAREDIARLHRCLRDKDSAINSTVCTFQEAERKLLCHEAERQSEAISNALTVKDLKRKLATREDELKAATNALAGGTSRLGELLQKEQAKTAALARQLAEEKAKNRPALESLLGATGPHFGAKLLPIFWRSDDYKTFEGADVDGACYVGEPVEGWSALADVMYNVGRACDCVAYGTGETLRARITVGEYSYDVNRKAKAV